MHCGFVLGATHVQGSRPTRRRVGPIGRAHRESHCRLRSACLVTVWYASGRRLHCSCWPSSRVACGVQGSALLAPFSQGVRTGLGAEAPWCLPVAAPDSHWNFAVATGYMWHPSQGWGPVKEVSPAADTSAATEHRHPDSRPIWDDQ